MRKIKTIDFYNYFRRTYINISIFQEVLASGFFLRNEDSQSKDFDQWVLSTFKKHIIFVLYELPPEHQNRSISLPNSVYEATEGQLSQHVQQCL